LLGVITTLETGSSQIQAIIIYNGYHQRGQPFPVNLEFLAIAFVIVACLIESNCPSKDKQMLEQPDLFM
jgi:hypothetical protein